MVSKMTPEQLAEMQRMAANMTPDMMQRAMAQMGSATPDQLAQMQRMTAGMSGDQLASQAAASMGAASAAGQQQADSAAAALKTEGNRLHGLGQYEQAADKYRQALDSLQGAARPAVCAAARTSRNTDYAPDCCRDRSTGPARSPLQASPAPRRGSCA